MTDKVQNFISYKSVIICGEKSIQFSVTTLNSVIAKNADPNQSSSREQYFFHLKGLLFPSIFNWLLLELSKTKFCYSLLFFPLEQHVQRPPPACTYIKNLQSFLCNIFYVSRVAIFSFALSFRTFAFMLSFFLIYTKKCNRQ